jgi:hypothetical protein
MAGFTRKLEAVGAILALAACLAPLLIPAEWLLVYGGAAAGVGMCTLGWPFTVKLAGMPLESGQARFWKWWATGLLVRSGLSLTVALLLMSCDGPHRVAATLTLAAVYLVGMFAETAWLSRRLALMDKRKHG